MTITSREPNLGFFVTITKVTKNIRRFSIDNPSVDTHGIIDALTNIGIGHQITNDVVISPIIPKSS